jgi:hypothetical protein
LLDALRYAIFALNPKGKPSATFFEKKVKKAITLQNFD